MAIRHVVPGLRPAQGNWWSPGKKNTTPVANCSVVGELRLKPPPPSAANCFVVGELRLNPQLPKKKTHRAVCYVCYVCCVLPLTPPLVCVWRVLCVLRVIGVACGTASEVCMYVFRVVQTHRSSKMPFPTNLYAGALPLEDRAANIMHGVRPGQTELVGYTEDEVWDHMLAPIQGLQQASLRKANLSNLIPLVPRCSPLDSSGWPNRF